MTCSGGESTLVQSGLVGPCGSSLGLSHVPKDTVTPSCYAEENDEDGEGTVTLSSATSELLHIKADNC